MMKNILLDTHVLVFDALFPERLSIKAVAAIDKAEKCYCADISLWEISMLISKKRIVIPMDTARFIKDLLLARHLTVLPISPEIAAASQQWTHLHKDPSDLLIAATAQCHRLALVTKDQTLHTLKEIHCVW